MKIIKAQKKDLEKIANITKIEFSKLPFNEKDSIKNILKNLNFYFKVEEIYVVVINRKIVGVIIFKIEQSCEERVIIIEELVVEEKFKKQGIGKKLMEFTESYAKKKKVKSISFSTHKKAPAVKFYQKLGYKTNKKRISMSKRIK